MKIKKCCNCKFFNYDELWDGEEEVQLFHCDKEHYDHIGWNTEPCEDYDVRPVMLCRANENKEMSKVSEMEMAYGEYLND